jgi:sugar phosphate isomerase/epimerase
MTHTVGLPQLALGSWAFSFGPFADRPWDFERVCRFTAAAGYEGVEINGFRPHPHHRDYDDAARTASLSGMMGDAGVAPAAYAPDLTVAPPGEVAADRYLSEIDAALRFCERMRIPLLRVDTVSSPEPLAREDYERRFERLVGTWGLAAERAARSGVTLVWEFEPGFWLNRPSEVLRVLEALTHPAFRILFDSSHAYTCAVAGARQGPEPEILKGGEVELARLLAPYIGHLHLIDSDGSLHNDETSSHLPFGTGKVDFPALLRALASAIDGLQWWGVDFCFCPTTEEDAPAAVTFVRSLVRQLHESYA